ncbi:MAG TPA: preprotein translocase subunit YajC, partial [Pseudoclavibacter sp.]|nr:preprotein translocase subunit YajC [Pseudoclavibacter sp.]
MDLTMLFMLVVIGIMLFFMYRSNKKRQAEARKLRDEA